MSRFQRHFSPVKPVSSAVTTSSQTTPTGDCFSLFYSETGDRISMLWTVASTTL